MVGGLTMGAASMMEADLMEGAIYRKVRGFWDLALRGLGTPEARDHRIHLLCVGSKRPAPHPSNLLAACAPQRFKLATHFAAFVLKVQLESA
jgi:hypothetical protein